MPRSTTERANAINAPGNDRVLRTTMAKARPFVVSSINTKRYAPAVKKKPVENPPPVPPLTSMKERIPVLRRAQVKQPFRPSSLSTAVPKMEQRRFVPNPMFMPVPSKTKVQKSSSALPPNRSSLKTFVPRPLRLVQRLKEGELIGGLPSSMKRAQVTSASGLRPRPSCVPRVRTDQSSTGVIATSKANRDITIEISATGPRNPVIARQQVAVNIGTTKTAWRVRTTETSVKNAGGCRTGTEARNGRLIPQGPADYPHVVKPAFQVTCSPLTPPDLSSFPSQSWTIVVDVDIKRIKTPTGTYEGKTVSSLGDTASASVSAGTPTDSIERCETETESSSRAPSLSPTIVETPPEATVGNKSGVEISTLSKTSAEVSDTVCTALITSPSGNGATSSATLARLMDRTSPSSPSKVSNTGNRTRAVIHSAFKIARSFFLPTQDGSQPGTGGSQMRRQFIPPLDKDSRASMDPRTQKEVEMLRMRRKVAGGGVVDPRLDRLNSLAAMSIITKVGESSLDGSRKF